MHYRYDNVTRCAQFSKIYGLAGARIGYWFAHEELIRNLLKVKLPFEPSSPAAAAEWARCKTKNFYTGRWNKRAWYEIPYAGTGRSGLIAVPSQANFVMTVLPSEADAVRVFDGC